MTMSQKNCPKNRAELDSLLTVAFLNGVRDLNFIDTSLITDMSHLFEGLKKMDFWPATDTSFIDISEWDVSQVKNMEGIFQDSDFNGDISKWNVSNVKHMGRMFTNSQFNGDLSSWNVSSVTIMTRMFENTPFNGDLSTWNVSNVKQMNAMFYRTPFNGDISKWQVHNVSTFHAMFASSAFGGELSNWKISPKAFTQRMFEYSAFRGYLSQMDDLTRHHTFGNDADARNEALAIYEALQLKNLSGIDFVKNTHKTL